MAAAVAAVGAGEPMSPEELLPKAEAEKAEEELEEDDDDEVPGSAVPKRAVGAWTLGGWLLRAAGEGQAPGSAAPVLLPLHQRPHTSSTTAR